MNKYVSPLILVWVMVVGQSWAIAQDDASITELLGAMAESQRSANMSGEFVQSKDGQAVRFRLARWVDQGSVFERLDRVDGGQPFTVLRRAGDWFAIDSGARTFTRMSKPLGLPPLNHLYQRRFEIESLYDVERLGPQSMDIDGASLPLQGYRFVPLDQHRYAYTLWVDVQSMQPLYRLYSWQGEMLESVRYTQFTASPSLSAAFFEMPAGLAEKPLMPMPLAEVPAWNVEWLPPGFVSMDPTESDVGAEQSPATGQKMFGDGIATVSVFVQPSLAPEGDEPGMFRSGVVSMISLPRKLAGRHWQVTALGEVPPRTLEMIVKHVAIGRP